MKYVRIAILAMLIACAAIDMYRVFEPRQPIIINNHIPECGPAVGKTEKL